MACASGLKTFELLERELCANSARVGAHLKKKLEPMIDKYPIVGDVRGLGLMIGMEIVKDKKNGKGAPDPAARHKILTECFNRGLLLLGCGPNSLRFAPPLIITKAQADCAVGIVEEAIKSVGGAKR